MISWKTILAKEAEYVTFFKQCDLPGYAHLRIDHLKGSIQLDYYAAFGKEPFDSVDISKLLEP